MKILFINEFSFVPGGTDQVMQSEVKSLLKNDIDIRIFSCYNKNVSDSGYSEKIKTLVYSLSGRYLLNNFQDQIDDYKPDIIHCHNLYPLLGVPIWNRIDSQNSKIVLHLHNFYPFCLNSFFYCGRGCTECLDNNSWIPGIVKRCKDKSLSKSLFLSLRRKPHTWLRSIQKVSMLICVSDYLRDIYVNAGVSPEKLVTIFNPVDTADNIEHSKRHILFLGNIRAEKGIEFFCKAALENPKYKFIAAGDGIMLEYLKRKFRSARNLHFTGFVNGRMKDELLRSAAFLVVPSLCPETFSIVTAEAFSYGVPVLTTGSGALKEFVIEGVTGRITDIKNLSSAIRDFREEIDNVSAYSLNCIEYAKRFSSDNHVSGLLKAYNKILS